MLVLSRTEQQKVLFPSLDISVEVLRVRGRNVSLGIQAPVDIPIQRAEIAGLKSLDFPPDSQSVASQLAELRRTIRESVQGAADRLNELHQTIERLAGEADSPDASRIASRGERLLLDLYRELHRLEHDAQPPGSASQPVHGEGPHALLVEDDQNERELMAGFFRMNGFQVVTAADGRDALDYLSLHARPDIVLLDMHMPRCDGASMVRQIRQQPGLKGIKLIAVSGATPEGFGLPIGPTGVNRWFQKPVNPEQLIHEVQRELASPSAAL